jgi:hypothetical protein
MNLLKLFKKPVNTPTYNCLVERPFQEEEEAHDAAVKPSLDELIFEIEKSILKNPDQWKVIETHGPRETRKELTNGPISITSHWIKNNKTTRYIDINPRQQARFEHLAQPFYDKYEKLKEEERIKRNVSNIKETLELFK